MSGYYAHRNKFYDVDHKLWNLVKPTNKKQRTLGSSSESDCELQTALEEMNSTSVPSQSSWKTDVSKLVGVYSLLRLLDCKFSLNFRDLSMK